MVKKKPVKNVKLAVKKNVKVQVKKSAKAPTHSSKKPVKTKAKQPVKKVNKKVKVVAKVTRPAMTKKGVEKKQAPVKGLVKNVLGKIKNSIVAAKKPVKPVKHVSPPPKIDHKKSEKIAKEDKAKLEKLRLQEKARIVKEKDKEKKEKEKEKVRLAKLKETEKKNKEKELAKLKLQKEKEKEQLRAEKIREKEQLKADKLAAKQAATVIKNQESADRAKVDLKEGLAEEIVALAEDISLDDIFRTIREMDIFHDESTDECFEKGCDNLSTTLGYCRYHYIKNWDSIKGKQTILKEGNLHKMIEGLVRKYPMKFVEEVLKDLFDDKSFFNVLKDLDLTEDLSFEDEVVVDDDADDTDIAFEAVRGIGHSSEDFDG